MLLQLYHEGMTTTPVPKYLSRQEAALALGVDVPAVDRLISSGLLDRYRIRGRYVRVPAGQVAELASLPREWLLRC
uniref:Helix-turn-helix DNA binding domain protein n=1 Tax=Streptomyces phage Geonosis TaxID=3158856 RepID=A0AAU7GX61_9CAUD